MNIAPPVSALEDDVQTVVAITALCALSINTPMTTYPNTSARSSCMMPENATNMSGAPAIWINQITCGEVITCNNGQ